MIDTHCHIFNEYYDDISKLINELKQYGIEKIIVNGCDKNSNLEVLKLVKQYECVYGAIGFHPTELDKFDNNDLDWLESHINDNKIVAIGEIGLDYHYDNTDKERQKNIFKKQLIIAEKFNKPVIIHSRDAIQDTFDIISNFNLRGSMHAFSGSLEMAKEFIKLGFYIGVGGVVTYKNAKNIVNVIENINLAYILLETDSPYLSPEGKRGQINTPCNLPIIVNKICELKNVSNEEVSRVTSDNAISLFDF